MPTLQELKEARVDQNKAAEALIDKAKEEDRDLTEEEAKAVDDHLTEAEKIKEQIRAKETTDRLTARLKDSREPATIGGPSRKPTIEVLGTPARHDLEQGGFKCIGEFAKAVMDAELHKGVDDRLFWAAAGTGMEKAIPASGGFLMPPSFSKQIQDEFYASTQDIMSRCDIYTVEGQSLTFTYPDDTSHANGVMYGGARGYWTEELDQMTSSYPTLRQATLTPHKLTTLMYASDDLLQGGFIALEQWLARAAGATMSQKINYAIINGTGSGQPLGIINSNALVSISAEDGQNGNDIYEYVLTENVSKMQARFYKAGNKANHVWLASDGMAAAMPLLNVNLGTSGALVYMPPGGMSQAPHSTLVGYPVIYNEWSPVPTSKGALMLVNLNAYMIGIRGGGIQSAMSIHLKFDYNQTAFRSIFHIDGQPKVDSALTPMNSGDTLSPFVALPALS